MDTTDQDIPKELKMEISWTKTTNKGFPYVNEDNDDAILKIRVNDFPDEPLYTLIKANRPICSFDNWPPQWKRTHQK